MVMPRSRSRVHVVEDLVLEFSLGDGAGAHEKAVGQGAFAVVDVGNDRKITNLHAAPKSYAKGTVLHFTAVIPPPPHCPFLR